MFKLPAKYHKRSLQDIVKKLIRHPHDGSDTDMIRSIFTWIITRDLSKYDDLENIDDNTVQQQLSSVNEGHTHLAELFKEMCG